MRRKLSKQFYISKSIGEEYQVTEEKPDEVDEDWGANIFVNYTLCTNDFEDITSLKMKDGECYQLRLQVLKKIH